MSFDSDYIQIKDLDLLQVIEKFEPFDKSIPCRGVYTYIVKGKETAARAWIDEFTSQYPPSSYGTTFQFTDINRTVVTYVVTRSSGCD